MKLLAVVCWELNYEKGEGLNLKNLIKTTVNMGYSAGGGEC